MSGPSCCLQQLEALPRPAPRRPIPKIGLCLIRQATGVLMLACLRLRWESLLQMSRQEPTGSSGILLGHDSNLALSLPLSLRLVRLCVSLSLSLSLSFFSSYVLVCVCVCVCVHVWSPSLSLSLLVCRSVSLSLSPYLLYLHLCATTTELLSKLSYTAILVNPL